jgi:pimeloyl-ACP methyl ester carboxylesterase
MLHVNGVEIAVFERDNTGQPAVLFVHATGFHARIWDQVIALLPEYHCYAIDLRGHGRSSKPTPPYDWRYFGEDVAAVGAALGLSGAIAVGHSVGGYAVTLAAAINPALFARLLLIDPVIMPREAYVGVREFGHFTARRRAEWSSPDEMYERFKDRAPFNAWKPLVLRDYVDYGLLPMPDGSGYVLACEPQYEAATYNYSTATDPYPAIAAVQVPVTLLRAGGQLDTNAFDMSASPTAPDLAAKFAHGTDVPLPQYSHFIPMEAPELVAEHVRKLS